MKDPDLVSILLVNYNGARLLPPCLDSLNDLSGPPHEVILVDNASTDGSLEVLRRYSWVRVVPSRENLGFAGGNNLGLRYCSGSYVLLLNTDTIVTPDFLNPLYDYLKQHPSVGIVQGKMVLPNHGNSLDVCGSFLTAWGLPYHYGYYKPDGAKYQRAYPVFSAKGACFMFRREVVDRAGGFLFDGDFFCYYEETDFCHRAWLGGYEVHFVPSPPIQHLMGATAGDPQSAFVLRHYLRNMLFSLLSNLSVGSWLRLLPPFLTLLAATMGVAALQGRKAQFLASWGALLYCARNFPKIRARRRLVRSFRRQSDRAIFAKVLRTPRLEYLVKTFTGQLGAYVDDSLSG